MSEGSGLKTYADAQGWLQSQGIELEKASFGLRGTLTFGAQQYVIQIGRASGGGSEVSVRPLPGGRVWWFGGTTLEGISRLLAEARVQVDQGRNPSWFEALRTLNSTMSALWPDEG